MSLSTLMFGWEYPPHHLGGLGIACQGLVKGLLRHGVRVTLVLPTETSPEEVGVDHRYPRGPVLKRVSSMIHPYDSSFSYHERLQRMPKNIQGIYGLNLEQAVEQYTAASIDMTKDVSTDVIHCHDWMTYEAGARAASYHRVPLVSHIHATEIDRTNHQPNQWIFERELQGFLRADKVIAVSNYTKNILTEHYGIPSEKIAVVYNGNSEPHTASVLTSEFRKRKPPTVLFLGRLALQKGTRQFLDMASQVVKVRSDVQFVIAGDGDLLGELVDYACLLGLQNNVLFAGRVSNPEARTLYEQASCFVMPSLSEPFGLVALEAIAHGTPVILSRQSGVSEVVRDAFIVDFWDTEKMSDCVLTILREEPLAMQLSSRAPKVLTELTWENQALSVRTIYEHLTCIHT